MARAALDSMRIPFGAALAALVVVAATVGPCSAQQRPKWELGAGGVFFTQPDYVGSDEYRFRPLGFPWFVYRGTRLRLDRESMQTRLFGTDLVRLDLSAGGQVSVNNSDNDRRRGMQDLDWIAQVGPALRFFVHGSRDGRHTVEVEVPLRVALAVAIDNFSYEGLVSSPKLVYAWDPFPWRVEANAGLEFGDDGYHDYIYGVQPAFAQPGRPAYDAEEGYAGARVSAGVSRYFGRFYVGLFSRYQYLGGATFEDSPMVGTDHFFVAGVAIGWVWLSSEETAPVGAEANLQRWKRSPRSDAPPAGDARTPTPSTAPPTQAPAPGSTQPRAVEQRSVSDGEVAP